MTKYAYSVEELAEIDPRGRTKLYSHIADGSLVARKDGKNTIILATDYVDHLNALPKIKKDTSDEKGE